MYTFAGTITLKGDKKINLDIDYIEIFKKSDIRIIFVYGETNLSSVEELLDTLKEDLGEFVSHDISFSRIQKLQIMNELFDEGVYEMASFEGEEVTFKEIRERFLDAPEVVSIREANYSEIFKNRIIKVDFLY